MKEDTNQKVETNKLQTTCQFCDKTIKLAGRKTLTGWIIDWRFCNCKEKEQTITESDKASDKAGHQKKQSSLVLEISDTELPELGDKYQVLALIGQGGMGSVLKVRDKVLDKTVAIKLLQDNLANNAAARKRFEQEAESASKLTHANLVTIYGHGKTDTGTPFLIMDYIEGESLADILEREAHLEPERALNLFSQIAEALLHAHQNGVIHRDIKPTNIIVSTSDSGIETARIVDFGIAKIMPTATRETCNLTQTGEVFGSPHYMSPEQCLGFMLDQRSDIYSLGCLMYETLSGEPPFSGSNPVQLVVKHINEDVKPFAREIKTGKIMQRFESVVMHCLEKDQTARFQTIDELLHDLEQLRTGKPVPKYHVGVKAKPTLTKRQTIGAIALTFLILFYVGIGGSAFNTEIVQKIFLVFMLIICGGGIYAFLPAGLAHLQKFHNQATPRQWWLALAQTSIGILGITFVPFILKEIILGYQQAAYWYNDIAMVGGISIFALSLTAIVSAIGYGLPSASKKVRFPYIASNAILMIVAIIASVVLAFPYQASFLPTWLADKAEHNHPALSVDLHRLAKSMDSSRVSYKLPMLLKGLGRLKEALNEYKNQAKNQIDSPNQVEIFDLNLQLGNFEDALAWLKSRPEDQVRMGYYLAATGQHQKALDTWGYKLEHQRTIDAPSHIVGSLIALGRYEEAIASSKNQVAQGYQFEEIQSALIQALILEKIGKTEEAERLYKQIPDMQNASGFNTPSLQLLMAYVCHRNGLEDLYQRYLSEAINLGSNRNELLDTLGLEYSGLKVSW